MAAILDLALPFFGLVALGVAAARIWAVGDKGLEWLNIFLIWFALPALIFLVVAAAPFEKLIDWPYVAATTSATVTAFLAVFVISWRLLGFAFKVAVLQGTAGSYGNVGYMGLPLAVAFFGPEAAVPAALVFCFDCTVQFTLTAFLATLGHERNEEAHWGEIALKILKQVFGHPFIVATILGGIASAFGFKAPGALGTILTMLMNSAGPVALFALGVTVGARQFGGIGREMPLVAGMKTLVQPALAFIALSLFVPDIDPLWRDVALMMAALPTASNAFILASQYKAYIEGSSTAVLITTIISAITIPLLIYIIQHG
ncbi:AEC family transporter [Aestuariivirga sp. YIM B02566]|uniref:AEC family transporter n=1 Tax=Taklimakanibacter albus TaxID=2800327 RepID=A0ACC5R2J6_9HYPH|nr:AEC family transporter [Aestuariivirga sp. YIM B02566]MBK1866877.1 AEC family transporter [Aestuariivirga sp. YIM B02566]